MRPRAVLHAPALLLLAGALASPLVPASSPGAWTALDRDAAKACAAAAGLRDPVVTEAPVRFDDTLGVDARLVTGIWPQPHMKGAKAVMLCLYDRRARRAQVQDAEAWRPQLQAAPKR